MLVLETELGGNGMVQGKNALYFFFKSEIVVDVCMCVCSWHMTLGHEVQIEWLALACWSLTGASEGATGYSM